jgi:hypothetical protein
MKVSQKVLQGLNGNSERNNPCVTTNTYTVYSLHIPWIVGIPVLFAMIAAIVFVIRHKR